jgi:hypothetical protein
MNHSHSPSPPEMNLVFCGFVAMALTLFHPALEQKGMVMQGRCTRGLS